MKGLAETDPLTGLYNRRALSEFLEAEIAAEDEETGFAIALVDLDDFKPVNDRYGHAVGDKLLVEVADRFGEACGNDAIVARMGGDEFAILLPRQSSLSSGTIADHILAVLVPPYEIEGHHIRIAASIGVADWPADGVTPQALFETADKALYAAKEGAPKSADHRSVA